ncbi:unnamed protein product [Cladocopium goreaui]|uniref:Uncharacterized protein n=1 Tax=Cladocopium goreaui TaxID=2562237 RepID=A0A9P1GEL1_9DINO|nr:unnamed protein product [Cladocopium goreaui]
MLNGRNLLGKLFSSVRRWCICGNRALLLGNALLLCSLYIVHFHKELGRREALEAAVEELHQALASSSDALQDARNQVVALTEMATRHQGGLQACEKRGKELVQQLEASLHTEEDKQKKLQGCTEELDVALSALNASREQQGSAAQAVKCCESVPMCNLCRIRR